METSDISKASKLARIDIGSDRKIAGDIERLLESFRQIQSVDLKGYEPMVLPPQCILSPRNDIPGAGIPKEEALKQASATQNGFYLVPKIVGEK
jgi:aspartyl-tRNA(Asn)/glutamyl-tRNA(Gln) amidotransferase subunit C